jgi:hypothetical protein
MKGRFIALVAAFVGALAMVAPSAAAPPAASSVQIERQATFVSPGSIVVTVVFTCPAGSASSVRVGVSQEQAVGPNTNGFSFMNVCAPALTRRSTCWSREGRLPLARPSSPRSWLVTSSPSSLRTRE